MLLIIVLLLLFSKKIAPGGSVDDLGVALMSRDSAGFYSFDRVLKNLVNPVEILDCEHPVSFV
jgi:hypothetical protein